MIEVAVTYDMAVEAGQRMLTKVLKNSIGNGDGNLAGALGEAVVVFVANARFANTYDYDLIMPDGSTADVKTKRCNSSPLPRYECSVSAFNTTQKCDRYIFVRVQEPTYNRAWILGQLPKAEFFKRAVLRHKGEKDPDNGMTFKCDCYNVRIDQLEPVSGDNT